MYFQPSQISTLATLGLFICLMAPLIHSFDTGSIYESLSEPRSFHKNSLERLSCPTPAPEPRHLFPKESKSLCCPGSAGKTHANAEEYLEESLESYTFASSASPARLARRSSSSLTLQLYRESRDVLGAVQASKSQFSNDLATISFTDLFVTQLPPDASFSLPLNNSTQPITGEQESKTTRSFLLAATVVSSSLLCFYFL